MDCGDILVKTVYGDIMENISHAGNLAHIMEAVRGFVNGRVNAEATNDKEELYSPYFAAYLAFN